MEAAFGFHLDRARHPACLTRFAVKLRRLRPRRTVETNTNHMGADLYISHLFDPHYKRWQRRFYKAVAYRDRLPEDAQERGEAQKRAEECYEKMYERGYFRDSYNDSNLLWKFDLSWWDDMIPMLNAQSRSHTEPIPAS